MTGVTCNCHVRVRAWEMVKLAWIYAIGWILEKPTSFWVIIDSVTGSHYLWLSYLSHLGWNRDYSYISTWLPFFPLHWGFLNSRTLNSHCHTPVSLPPELYRLGTSLTTFKTNYFIRHGWQPCYLFLRRASIDLILSFRFFILFFWYGSILAQKGNRLASPVVQPV